MKADIHPNYIEQTITCSTCGTVVHTHGTVPTIRIDLCSQCHPFYTGKQRIVDTAGRVDRFNQRRIASEKVQKAAKTAATKKSRKDDRPSVPELSPAELAPAELAPSGNAPENANAAEGATSVGENV